MSLKTAFQKCSNIYHNALNKHPIMAQSIQVGTLMGIGDCTAQLVKNDKFDVKRAAKFTSIGLFYVGPLLFVWYRVLQRYVTGNNKSLVVIKKVVYDQLIFSPISMAAFLVVVGITERQNPEEIEAKIKKEYLNIMGANYVVWPCVQFVNFYFIPAKFQIVFNQGFACLWNAFISYKTH